jgi:lipopolysaccharide assembly protein A
VNRLRWLVTIPLAVVLVVFAVSNRAPAEVDLWPLGLIVAWPLFVYVFLGAAIGLLFGAVFAWISSGAARKQSRARKARISELEHLVATRDLTRTQDTDSAPHRPPALPE